MSIEYAKLVEREESVLFVTLISLGFEKEYFGKALGWDYGVQYHKYEERGHYVSRQDLAAVRELITGKAESEPEFWEDYIGRCYKMGREVIRIAKAVMEGQTTASQPEELLAGFEKFTNATKEMVPFLLATVAVQGVLETFLTSKIADEIGGKDPKKKAKELLPRLLVPREEVDAIKEIHNAYQIALAMLEDPGLDRLLKTESRSTIIKKLQTDYSKIHKLLLDHVEEFGWLRTHGYRFDPLSLDELIERIQNVVKRWDTQVIKQATQSKPKQSSEDLLGFKPSPALADLVTVLQTLINLRFYRIEVHLQADVIVRPFFARISDALDCTREELIFSTEIEIRDALSKRTTLPKSEIQKRMNNWFIVTREHEKIQVKSYETPLKDQVFAEGPVGSLKGLSASQGRATGRARILFGASEVDKVELGDILVTTMTTPDLMLAIERAAAIVTDEGGILSHAAIISRELGIPCIIGTANATRVVKDGEIVEVDATKPEGSLTLISE